MGRHCSAGVSKYQQAERVWGFPYLMALLIAVDEGMSFCQFRTGCHGGKL